MRKALPKTQAQSSLNREASAAETPLFEHAKGTRKGANLVGVTWLGRASVVALVLGTLAGASLVTGCAVSESDVLRWERTERGPYKLVAVVTHDKYSLQLRIDSALSLIKMPARGGRRMGISYLVDKFTDEDSVERDGALVQLPEESRKKVVDGMAPEMIKAMLVPPPVRNPDGTMPPDESIPYKDAAYAMLSHEPSLVSDPKTKADFVAALNSWVQTDFENRIENNSQQYGIESIMRFLHDMHAGSLQSLPGLINENSTKVDKIAALVAELGDADTKQKTSDALVALAKRFDSDAWINKERPIYKDLDDKQGSKVTPAQLEGQLKQGQDQALTGVFSSMKRIGGRSVIDYCIAYGSDAKNSPERRQAALAALEGRVDKNNQADIDHLFAIAKDDNTPDAVRDLAFARLGELPKELIVPKLYTLFEAKKWKVRWVAATQVLKTLTTKEVPDFMKRLPSNPSVKMGMTEPISYGDIISKMSAPPGAPKPKDVINTYLGAHELGPKLSAIGSFYGGNKADVGKLTALETDASPVPKCDKDDDCGWSCDVPKAPNSQEMDSKTIVTVGDFVKYCVVPSMTNK
jgi:hypothetical protein